MTKSPELLDVYTIFADPRVVSALLVVIIGSMIIPMVKAYIQDKKARKNLVRMMYEDVIDRNDRLDKSISSISGIVNKTISDSNFIPIIIDAKGEDYLDLKAEKWMIPNNLTQPVLKFYNLTKGLEDFAKFIDGDKFSKLESSRRVAILKGMEERMKRANKAGQVLSSLIEADWPEVRRK
tara:strand:- start:2108 stop:2647 length:540 start_codon:yes stop_codon:yes gene_type:complete